MKLSNRTVSVTLFASILFIVLFPVMAMAGGEWKRAYIDSEGDRYYYYSKSVSVGNGGDGINHFVEMRVYPSPGSKEFDSVKVIVKDVIQTGKNKLITSDISEDYLYNEIQAEIDCSKDKVKFKHTDYIAVGDTYIWSDLHEPEKWQDIDSDSMKAIRDAVCR